MDIRGNAGVWQRFFDFFAAGPNASFTDAVYHILKANTRCLFAQRVNSEYCHDRGCRSACRPGSGRQLTWAEPFDGANAETRHMIIVWLAERIDISHDCEAGIKLRISAGQYMRITA